MDSVQVAVRVRPLVPHEIERGCRTCIEVIPEAQQIVTKLRRDKFTFNYVFDSSTPQVDVYESAIQNLVKKLFQGYNVTVLAYGQTGSGKTFSMGTCPSSNESDVGIIPRAISDIFDVITTDEEWIFKVAVSFLELYNEQLIDLLTEGNKQNVVDIRESNRGICIPGLSQRETKTAEEVMRCLQQGSLCRTTGATAMNSQSSRSHAIFTIYVQQTRKNNANEALSAKFHLVDLAGSERSKKTKAEGKRFQEGVNINKGLFVLGNVISALCDGAPFVNYRDSKLTRLLQDSLGGNSLTLMLACVSPADSNLDETINTLRYADRALKIKNKPVINQDPNHQEISRLKQEIVDLQLALLSRGSGEASCPPEHQQLLQQVTGLLEKNKLLSTSLDSSLMETTRLLERAVMAEAAQERQQNILSKLNVEITELQSTFQDVLVKDKLIQLKSILNELKNEHERSESERRKFEEQLCVSVSSNEDKSINPEEDDATREEYVLEQARLNREIQELSKDLAWKEALAAKLAESNSLEASIKHGKEEDVAEMKTQIEKLLHEKEELEKQLKNQRTAPVDHRLEEQRSKRMKELEDKINALNKKIMDQNRVIKIKERNEEKIKTLNQDILKMKQTKVRLINQMKNEGEKYRQWRVSREKEMYKLRQQNQQKETKFVKMEMFYQKQQNVYKRKLEESASVIKRLKDLAASQKSSKEKRSFMGNAEKVNQWVTQEFSAIMSALDAEYTLESLIEDRAVLAKELAQLKNSAKQAGVTDEDSDRLQCQIKSLNEDIELRSTQIVDLKEKLQSLDSYQDNKSKNRFDSIQTMADAKIAMKCVFDTAIAHLTEMYKDKSARDAQLQELQTTYNTVLAQLQEKEELLKLESDKLVKSETYHNERVFVLLKRLQDMANLNDQGNSTGPLKDLSNFDVETEEPNIDKQIIEQQRLRIEELEKELEKRKSKKVKATKASDNWNTAITPETRKRFFEEDDEEIENLDDSTNDPDWRKTPIYRRLQALTKKERKVSGLKRNIDGQPTCGCSTNCATKLCSCVKLETICSGNCRCSDEKCQNKEAVPKLSIESQTNNSSSEEGDILFKKPRLLSHNRADRP